jgi:methylenetetrahydrofolate dehydrogenase (NADP+)/methenyltetrahydrofolate cyclohydrolase
MAAQIISGTDVARAIREEVAEKTRSACQVRGSVPGLATVLVGEDPASQAYVRMKNRDAEEVGFLSRQIDLAASTSEDELLGWVEGLNSDPEIAGILVQLPLPPQISEARILSAIDPAKDVDGFNPVNVGRLSAGDPGVLAPCTPSGIVELLVRGGHDPAGRHVVIVGRSNIVGKPLASLLLGRGRGGNATVTVVHSRTQDLSEVTQTGEILIVAVGQPEIITAEMVRPGAVVIDVGINRVVDPSTEKGYRLTGDVEFVGVSEVASAITPVPGGVGPMTRAMLLVNTLSAYLASEDPAG